MPEVPPIEVGHQEFLSDLNPFGIKGCGEGGAVSPPAAIANAVADALRPLHVNIKRVPLRPEALLVSQRHLVGRVVYVDRFGNCITDIPGDFLVRFLGELEGGLRVSVVRPSERAKPSGARYVASSRIASSRVRSANFFIMSTSLSLLGFR